MGPPGPGGFSVAYVWGYGTITNITRDLSNTNITFEIDYVNLGNLTAFNVVANYVLYIHPGSYAGSFNFTSQVTIGDLPRYTAGSISTRLVTGIFNFQFMSARVSFTWS